MELLSDGQSRTIEMLAEELSVSTDQVKRDLEFLERVGAIRRIGSENAKDHDCSTCGGCADGQKCKSCAPEGGFKNMGSMWEVLN